MWRQEKMNEQDSQVEVVRGCLTEGVNSIVGVFFREPLRASYKASNEILG